LDIFKSYQFPNGRWSPPQNLKPPINSPADDFGYLKDPSRDLPEGVIEQGYFSSSRKDGIGSDDIYRFVKYVPPPTPPEEEATKEEIEYKMILEGYVLEKIFEVTGDPNSEVLGRKPLPGSKVIASFSGRTEKFKIGKDGFFTLELEEETDYEFFASRPEYLSNSNRFSTKGIGKDPNLPVMTFEIEIVLDKIYKDKEIVLKDIYYDFDKWAIREDAKPTLNELAQLLRENPTIAIEMGSHTDCRGSVRYNEDLSKRRAQSAVDYLITKGIAPGRLGAKGYGENVPAADCACSKCTEEEHQRNRRTTFKIVE